MVLDWEGGGGWDEEEGASLVAVEKSCRRRFSDELKWSGEDSLMMDDALCERCAAAACLIIVEPREAATMVAVRWLLSDVFVLH